jgi:hypothetical protein
VLHAGDAAFAVQALAERTSTGHWQQSSGNEDASAALRKYNWLLDVTFAG